MRFELLACFLVPQLNDSLFELRSSYGQRNNSFCGLSMNPNLRRKYFVLATKRESAEKIVACFSCFATMSNNG